MSIVMLIAKGPMIGAVFSATLKTFIMGTFVLARQLFVVPVVRAVTVVFIIVRESWDDRRTQHQNRSCYKSIF